jgi:hypothetical protein
VNITLRKDPAADLQLKFSSGQPGAPGQNAVLTVGSVTITGSAPLQTLSLGLPEGRTGPVGEGSGGLFFDSRASAASATIGAGITTIRTAGYAAPGDGGHGLYTRLNTHPIQALAERPELHRRGKPPGVLPQLIRHALPPPEAGRLDRE